MAASRCRLSPARLARPLALPGAPRIPAALALLVLRFPALVPVRLRWHTAASGLGLVVAALSRSPADRAACVEQTECGSTSPRRGGRPVGEALEEIGEAQGRVLRESIDYGRTLLECARAVALANRLYNIQASAVKVSEREARVVTPGCPWSSHEWWGKAPCGAFSRYEAGLVRGLNPEVTLTYSSKRTRGDQQCVGVYRWRNE